MGIRTALTGWMVKKKPSLLPYLIGVRESSPFQAIPTWPLTPSLQRLKGLAESVIKENGNGGEEAFLVGDLGELRRKFEEWKLNFPAIKPYYAVKCNPSETVIRSLVEMGAGFDCATQTEIKNVLSLGVSPSDIIFANPVKLPSHMAFAAHNRIPRTTFDSEEELLKIRAFHPSAKVVLRIKLENQEGKMTQKFGARKDEVPNLLRTALDLNLDVQGVSFHVGSGAGYPNAFGDAIRATKDVFRLADKKFGRKLKLVDLGGGFPGNVPLSRYSKIVNGALREEFPPGEGVEVIAEPGQYFVTTAFATAVMVHGVKRSVEEDMYYVNDGIYGTFEAFSEYQDNLRPVLLNDTHNWGKKLQRCSIWGQTCDAVDVVSREVYLPSLNVGQWLLFPNRGAYSLSTCTEFNGFPVPQTYFVRDEAEVEIRGKNEEEEERGGIVEIRGVGRGD